MILILTVTLPGPPYHFSISSTGLTSVSTLIGATMGVFLGGYAVDKWFYRMSRQRNGVFEPEYRLVCMFPLYLSGPLGLLLFGFGFDWHWIVPVTALGFGYLPQISTDDRNVHIRGSSECCNDIHY